MRIIPFLLGVLLSGLVTATLDAQEPTAGDLGRALFSYHGIPEAAAHNLNMDALQGVPCGVAAGRMLCRGTYPSSSGRTCKVAALVNSLGLVELMLTKKISPQIIEQDISCGSHRVRFTLNLASGATSSMTQWTNGKVVYRKDLS